MREMINAITKDVGLVRQIFESDPNRKIIVFEEVHSSILGQIEITLMLNRLYEDYYLRTIGLEGAFAAEKHLDCSWFHFSPSFKAKDLMGIREDVVVQLLEKGEISSSEMMALVYEDIDVVGIENTTEYNYKLTSDATVAIYIYLYKIALAGMTRTQIVQAGQLKGKDHLDYVINTDDWARKRYASITDVNNIFSIEKTLMVFNEIEDKILGIDVGITEIDKKNFYAQKMFYKIASMRSETMVSNTLDLLKSSSSGLVAMIIGAAHTERIVELLIEAKVSFVVIRGNSLADHTKNGRLSAQAYNRKASSPPLSVDAPGMLGAFLDNRRRKPEPVTKQDWFRWQSMLSYHIATLASAVYEGVTLDELKQILRYLPILKGMTIDENSLKVEGNDTIFRVKVLKGNVTPVDLQVRTRFDKKEADKILEVGLTEARERVKASDTPGDPTAKPDHCQVITQEIIAEFTLLHESMM